MNTLSKMNDETASLGICDYMFLIMFGLKIAKVGDVADWSWWLITAPLWGSLIFVLVIGAIAIIFKK